MGWKEFFASLVGSIAWPTVILVLGIIFRTQLVEVLQRLRGLKVSGAEATFASGLDRVETQVENFQATEDEDVVQQAREDAQSEEGNATNPNRADLDPSGTVLQAWEHLVNAVKELRRSTAGRGRPSNNIRIVLSQLRDDGVVNDLYVESVLGLQGLRNRVAHAEEIPSSDSASIYWRTADELRRAANAIAKVRGRDE
ncbi:MAG: hypothetical protein ACOH14_01290 [Rhodoglobus sp.]